MANNNYVPATRRTSNTGSRPSNDPLNLVKISRNPLAVQAQETIQILEEQKIHKTEEYKKDGNEAWRSQLDNWKSKRKSSQPSSFRSLDVGSFEEPHIVTTSRTPFPRRDDDGGDDNDDDEGDKTIKNPVESKKAQDDASVSQEEVFDRKSMSKDYPYFKEKTKNDDADDGLKTCAEVTPTVYSVSNIAISKTVPSTQTFKTSSLKNASLNSPSSTPKEAVRRSNTSAQAIERPKSSFVPRNVPKVPTKRITKNFPSIPESDPIEVSKKKSCVEEEKTAQASIKKFNNIKNFFEKVSQNVDSDVKGSTPAVRRGTSSAGDPKKRMSLGPGVLERSSRGSVAIANDKEFIIDEHFVDSSKSPIAKFQAKHANERFQMKERESTKSITSPVKSPTMVYSFSNTSENATPAKSDISMEDFKGMISLPTSSPSSVDRSSQPKRRTGRADELDGKTEDEVFASSANKVERTLSSRFTDPREIKKATTECDGAAEDVPIKSAEDVPIKSASRGIKTASTDKPVKELHSILKHNVQKDVMIMSFNDDEIQYMPVKTPMSDDSSLISKPPAKYNNNDDDGSKDECNHLSPDGTCSIGTSGVDVNRGRDSSKHEDNLNSSVSTKKVEEASIAEDSPLESIEVEKSGQESGSIGKQMKETKTHITSADYTDLNSYSAKIDKLLEELKFIPTSLMQSKTGETTSQLVEDEKPAKMNDSEPKKPEEAFEAVDGKSCNYASVRASVGHLPEKTLTQGRAMPSVATFKSLRPGGVDGDPQKMKDNDVPKTAAFPKVPPKPVNPAARANSCKISALFSGPSNISKKDDKIEFGVDLNTKATPQLLDVSASRSKVELSRRAKRRPPSIKGRSLSLEDFLDSAPIIPTKSLIVVDVVEDKNGFYPPSSDTQDKKLHQREEETSIDDDDDDDDKPPSLPSCPPPIMFPSDEAPLMFRTADDFSRTTTTLSLQEAACLADSDEDDDALPESSV